MQEYTKKQLEIMNTNLKLISNKRKIKQLNLKKTVLTKNHNQWIIFSIGPLIIGSVLCTLSIINIYDSGNLDFSNSNLFLGAIGSIPAIASFKHLINYNKEIDMVNKDIDNTNQKILSLNNSFRENNSLTRQ